MSTKKLNFILFFILLFFIIFGIQGEKIQVNSGLGWDGLGFSETIKNLNATNTPGTDTYSTQRILPFTLIWIISKVFNFSLNNQNIVSSFLILNSALILISFYFWNKITAFYNFNKKVKTISFFAIFLNYAILKMTFYYPVLTDTVAFTLGLASFYYYIKKDNLKLLLTIALGVFSFPTLIYVGSIFFLWPYKTPVPLNKEAKNLNHVFIFSILILYVILGILLFTLKPNLLNEPAGVNANLINYSLFPLSVILTLTYLYIISSSIDNLDFIKLFLISFNKMRIVCVLVMVVISKLLIFILSTKTEGFGMKNFGLNLFLQSLTNPLSFLISHIMYIGPIIILVLLFYKPFINTAKKEGVGTYIFVLFYLFLSIGNESRQFLNAFPVLLILFCLSIKDKFFSWKLILSLGFLSLLYSRFWFVINKETFKGSFLEFPSQNYFMSQGPWMSNKMYLIFLITILTTSIIFYSLFKKELLILIKDENK